MTQLELVARLVLPRAVKPKIGDRVQCRLEGETREGRITRIDWSKPDHIEVDVRVDVDVSSVLFGSIKVGAEDISLA